MIIHVNKYDVWNWKITIKQINWIDHSSRYTMCETGSYTFHLKQNQVKYPQTRKQTEFDLA